MELLIGCGTSREKRIHGANAEWTKLVTLDVDPAVKPDIVHDLNTLPLPFDDNQFAEIHAYEVLEHTGRQGDFRFFFAQFSEFHRILEPNGLFCGSCPRHDSRWAWGDPGHTRIISLESLFFLDQRNYADVGATPMTDYRPIYKADFELVWHRTGDTSLAFALRAIK